MVCIQSGPRNNRERPGPGNLPLRPETVTFFCNSAMELILVILKMASPSQEVHSKSEPHVVMLLPLSWTVTAFTPLYTCMHLHFYVPSIKVPVTLSEHRISRSARFKNTIIELLKTSTDLQISKGVGALKQLFLKKKGYSSPLLSPLPKTHVS